MKAADASPSCLIVFIGLKLGRTGTRALLYPITLYFVFRRGPSNGAQSRAFLTHSRVRTSG